MRSKITLITAASFCLYAAPQALAQDMIFADEIGQLELTQDAWSSHLRARGESKRRPGYVRYVYDAQQAFPIRAREGMVTTIKLPEGETISQAYAGDEAGFQVGIPTPQTIVIKANFPGVDTNLIAYGDSGAIYTFYLRSDPINAEEISDFLVDVIAPTAKDAYFGAQMDRMSSEQLAKTDERYPSAAAQRIRDPYGTLPDAGGQFAEYAEWTDFNPATVRQDLGVYVPREKAGGTIPYKVFRDDRFTYIDYGPNASQMTEWPTPVIVIQGVEGPVGNRTAGPGGRLIVIEALGEFVLRNGQRMIVVKPRSTSTAANLVEYPTFDGQMNIATDLPPGRPGNVPSAPKTVVPAVHAAPTVSGEHPTSVVAINGPTDNPAASISPRSVTVTETATHVAERPVARGKGAPIRTTLQTTKITTGAAPVPVATGSAPVPNAAPTPHYYVSLGTGSRQQMEDKWRSALVQHYDLLNYRAVHFAETPEGVELQINTFTSASPAIDLCKAMTEQTSCSVKRAG
jgi:type IV secretory pathway VirB9-like protein